MRVLLAAVRAGIAAERVDVEARMLFQNRDFPALNDYRTVTACVAHRLYGLDQRQLDHVFPAAPMGNYPFI